MSDPQPPANPPNPPPNPPANPPAPPADPPPNPGIEGLGAFFNGIAQQLSALPEKFADVLEERAPKPPAPPAPPANPPADPPANPQGVKTAEDKGKKSWAERVWFS